MYDNLDEGVLGLDGNPYFKNKKLAIKYEIKSYCDAKIYYSKVKYVWIDMIKDMNKFNKITKNYLFVSHKYLVDSFNELTLNFSLRKIIDGEYHKYKYWGLDINLDAMNVTYIWE